MCLNVRKSRHRIVSASAPRITSQDPPDRKIQPLYGTMFFYGLKGVGRAGGCESAGSRLKRRDAVLIALNQQQEWQG